MRGGFLIWRVDFVVMLCHNEKHKNRYYGYGTESSKIYSRC